MRLCILARLATLLCAHSAVSDTPLVGQTYRRVDASGNAVTLPAAAGMPSITAIATAPDDGFSILHAREGNIHHFDGNGRLLRRFGRASDSTATFERLSVHGWHGSTPWAHERNSRHVVVFDGRTARISTTIDMPRYGPVMVESMTPDGAPVVLSSFRQAEGAVPQYRYGYAVLPGFGMAPKAPLVTLPTSGCGVQLGERSVLVPWCQRALGVVAPGGEWLAMVTGAQGSGAVRVVFLSMRGDTLGAADVDAPRVPVLPADAAVHLDAEVRSHRLNASHARQFRDAVAAQPHYPVASWLIATNDRTLWLVQQTAQDTRYIVVSTSGRVIDRFSTAPNLRLMAAAGRTAFGVRTLPTGREQVVRVRF